MSAPMFKASGEPPISVPQANSLVHGIFLADCQIPEKSGRPSGSRGAGALRFGLPSAVRGTPGVGRNTHCPDASGDTVMTNATAVNNARFLLTSSVQRLGDAEAEIVPPALRRRIRRSAPGRPLH